MVGKKTHIRYALVLVGLLVAAGGWAQRGSLAVGYNSPFAGITVQKMNGNTGFEVIGSLDLDGASGADPAIDIGLQGRFIRNIVAVGPAFVNMFVGVGTELAFDTLNASEFYAVVGVSPEVSIGSILSVFLEFGVLASVSGNEFSGLDTYELRSFGSSAVFGLSGRATLR